MWHRERLIVGPLVVMNGHTGCSWKEYGKSAPPRANQRAADVHRMGRRQRGVHAYTRDQIWPHSRSVQGANEDNFTEPYCDETLGLTAFDRSRDRGLPSQRTVTRPGPKVLTLAHAMIAGGTHIDHADMLRSDSAASLLGHRVMVPSTLGTFLQPFTFGHVQQPESRQRSSTPTGLDGGCWTVHVWVVHDDLERVQTVRIRARHLHRRRSSKRVIRGVRAQWVSGSSR